MWKNLNEKFWNVAADQFLVSPTFCSGCWAWATFSRRNPLGTQYYWNSQLNHTHGSTIATKKSHTTVPPTWKGCRKPEVVFGLRSGAGIFMAICRPGNRNIGLGGSPTAFLRDGVIDYGADSPAVRAGGIKDKKNFSNNNNKQQQQNIFM